MIPTISLVMWMWAPALIWSKEIASAILSLPSMMTPSAFMWRAIPAINIFVLIAFAPSTTSMAPTFLVMGLGISTNRFPSPVDLCSLMG